MNKKKWILHFFLWVCQEKCKDNTADFLLYQSSWQSNWMMKLLLSECPVCLELFPYSILTPVHIRTSLLIHKQVYVATPCTLAWQQSPDCSEQPDLVGGVPAHEGLGALWNPLWPRPFCDSLPFIWALTKITLLKADSLHLELISYCLLDRGWVL